MTEVHVPAAPPIAGLRFRTYEGKDDVPAITRVMNAAVIANGNPEYRTEAMLRNWVRHPSNSDPYQDVLLAFAGDELVAVAIAQWEDASEGMRHYQTTGWVEPRWRGRGLGSAMLPRQEERLREIAHGHRHALPPLLVTWVDATDPGADALVRANGYTAERTFFHMVRPDLDQIELAPEPEGIHIRPAVRSELRSVWEAMKEAFRDHPGGMETSDAAHERWAASPMMDPSLLFVAFDGDDVAAAVQGAISSEENEARGYLRGWTEPIFTRRPWRRRGLASACLGRTLLALRDRGMTSAQLGVDTQNPNDALSLYRRHRFEPAHTETEWHKPLTW
jgi:GNAT superfamily N-acetyltransferase